MSPAGARVPAWNRTSPQLGGRTWCSSCSSRLSPRSRRPAAAPRCSIAAAAAAVSQCRWRRPAHRSPSWTPAPTRWPPWSAGQPRPRSPTGSPPSRATSKTSTPTRRPPRTTLFSLTASSRSSTTSPVRLPASPRPCGPAGGSAYWSATRWPVCWPGPWPATWPVRWPNCARSIPTSPIPGRSRCRRSAVTVACCCRRCTVSASSASWSPAHRWTPPAPRPTWRPWKPSRRPDGTFAAIAPRVHLLAYRAGG